MNKIFLLGFILIPGLAIAQTKSLANSSGSFKKQEAKSNSKQVILTSAEIMPSYPGGFIALNHYLEKNVKTPEQAVDHEVSGNVYLSFLITESGKITDIIVVKGLGYGCDEEATRVIKKMPDWIPAQQNGKKITLKYNLAIRFNKK